MKSNGTFAGTVQVKDIAPGTASSGPREMVSTTNGFIYFSANGPAGRELWRSNGTAAGTIQIKDINPGLGDSELAALRVLDDTIYFRANNGSSGRELWRSSGSAAGTVLVQDIIPGSAGSYPRSGTNVPLATVAGKLIFTANSNAPSSPTRLWTSTGNSAGTLLLGQVGDETADGVDQRGNDANYMVVNNTIFFSGDSSSSLAGELWKTDGNTAGTVRVKSFTNTDSYDPLSSFINFNGTLFFTVNDGTHGVELWKSDGTGAGTTLVKDINPGLESSFPRHLAVVGDTLFFQARSSSGAELWKSDGTTAGTVLVSDIAAGSASSNPALLTAVGSTLYFAANNGVSERNCGRAMALRPAPCRSVMLLQDQHRRTPKTWYGWARISTSPPTIASMARNSGSPQACH